ncbi:hypothetical protein Clacol_007453 [Clathrus columnatus]|uniref:Peptidase A1 domain-containing protein n=1 Tax=Clathrus columnatus TaxID=1419009 RepID=A0AAV5AF01_9AGAM|nr:hypothetical protein Clacol_007453 [Clathrus columnatus]
MYSPRICTFALLTATSVLGFPARHDVRVDSPSPLTLTTQFKSNLRNGGLSRILKNDLARLDCFNQPKKPGGIHVSTTDLLTSFLMTTSIQVGNPPQTFEVLVDTGSSNLIVGANPNSTQYHPTRTSRPTGDQVAIQFGSGEIAGNEVTDQVSIGGVTVTGQSLSIPTQEAGFVLFDGIVGLGPDDLTLGTLVQNPNQVVPTLTDASTPTLAQQKHIKQPLAALTIPLAAKPQGGSIDFGVPDPKKFNSPITFAPSTGNGFWSATQTITYGKQKLNILEPSPGVFDSGTSLLFLPTPAFQAYAAATNATVDPETGLLTVPDPKTLESLYFEIGGTTFEFTPNAQKISKVVLQEAGVDPSSTLLVIADGGSLSVGINFINGFVWL